MFVVYHIESTVKIKSFAWNIDFSEASKEELVREARIANRLYRMGQTGVWDA